MDVEEAACANPADFVGCFTICMMGVDSKQAEAHDFSRGSKRQSDRGRTTEIERLRLSGVVCGTKTSSEIKLEVAWCPSRRYGPFHAHHRGQNRLGSTWLRYVRGPFSTPKRHWRRPVMATYTRGRRQIKTTAPAELAPHCSQGGVGAMARPVSRWDERPTASLAVGPSRCERAASAPQADTEGRPNRPSEAHHTPLRGPTWFAHPTNRLPSGERRRHSHRPDMATHHFCGGGNP